MPTADQHASSKYVKLIYMGDSGTGKTGSLVSLVADGYKLKIIDMDNGLDALVAFVRKECPDNLKNIEYETYRDIYSGSSAGMIVKGTPKAYTQALTKLTEWSQIEDEKTVLIIDSLSAMGKACYEWVKSSNPAAKDPRNWFFGAQQSIENVIAGITGEQVKLNVMIISHVNYKEVTEGVHKGHVNAIGSALGPVIPKYFNTMVLAESIGSGVNTKRKIKTLPTGVVDLKNPAPFKLEPELPLGTGLATIFKTIKEN